MPTSYAHISVHPSPTFFFLKYNICAACLSLHVTQKPFLGTLKKCWRNNSWHLILLYIIRVINDQTFFATWQHIKSWIPITLLYEGIVNRYVLGYVGNYFPIQKLFKMIDINTTLPCSLLRSNINYHYIATKIVNNLVKTKGKNGLRNANDKKYCFLWCTKKISRGLHEQLGCVNYLLKCFC